MDVQAHCKILLCAVEKSFYANAENEMSKIKKACNNISNHSNTPHTLTFPLS
jgi:hypothetical protein